MRRLLCALALAVSTPMTAMAQAVQTDDPYLWLEDIEGAKSLAWVKEHNDRSLGVLQADPRYAELHDKALAIVNATDRIPVPGFNRDGTVDNFWQDKTNVRGLWRRTSLDSYRTPAPQWETVLDFDALAKAENANWVYKGATCLSPEERYCLVSLSNGGKDAVTIREYDSVQKRFVENGFVLPESKGGVTWIDHDTLLVARDFGPGTMTKSGYPFVLKRLKRGQSLDQAQEIFRGTADDVSVDSYTLRDADGALQATIVVRGKTFWESENFLLTDKGLVKLPLPEKSSVRALVDGQLVFTTEQDWNGFKVGDLLAYDLAALKADPAEAKAELILRPGARESIEGVSNTRNKLIVALYENVKGGAYAYSHGAKGWTRTKLDLPANSTVSIGSAAETSDQVFFTVSNYLNPQTLWLADAASGKLDKLKAMPDRFDGTGHVVEQFEATSADGTKIPYFVVRPKGAKLDGSNPTVLYGYGGYQNSLLPSYSGTLGKLWLERGGTYVVANTRGGGEFGPAWHEAALQQNRHKAHEDFIAVAQDLIARKITSPRRLGIMGGSQGGLFMGVAMTKHPELFNAAVIQVPLFDMMRFHKLLAGASWMAEYGNPDIPEQRAWILEYSPYQALKAGQTYPEPFIETSTKDDRVHPGHARKAVAKLEALGYPVLYYENTDGGHAAGANLLETARRVALEYTYLTRKLMD
ncbi:prolyl oligopeptidase family protein [Caulobacter sp. 17J80-11]|uniref:prolyl oligopeptidase family serine peptidase n=1 Tax=Caulobacter sp. 17J80-11 TaxID=2763502 RepID=UPI0016536D0A|nr:prolyl oligopeptidase family serine peptidase [Caulobacter sp. 17J80-11]MBC6983178.1 S9 family peptidase [Caulobacter sp. 17J80-11]